MGWSSRFAGAGFVATFTVAMREIIGTVTLGDAMKMLVPPPLERFDLADARLTNALLGALRQ